MSKTAAPPHPPQSLPGKPRFTWLVPLWMRRHRHLTVPLLLVPAVFPAAGLALHTSRWRAETLIASGVVLACVWFFAPHKWDRPAERFYAIASVAAAGGWLTFAAYRGFSRWTWIAAVVLAALWGVPWWWHKRVRLYSSSARLVRSWNSWWQANSHLWNGQGSGVIDLDPRRDVEELRIQLVPGVHHAEVVKDWLPRIESALQGYVRHGMVRGQVDPRNPSQALIQLRRENPLRDDVEWDPKQAPSTITQPAPIGKHGAGNWVKTLLLRNWFVLGMTRWGKSNWLSAFLATVSQCDDALPWLIDMKGGRATRPWLPALDWAAVTIDEARLLLGCALAEIQARAEDAESETEQLEPTPEVPALFVIIDETHEVTSLPVGDTECAVQLSRVVSLGNGLAVYGVVATQYGSLDESVRFAQTRANLDGRVCFHVASSRDGQFALEDWAKLDASRLDVPGSFYYQLGARASVEDAKGPHMPHALVRMIAAANGKLRASRPPLRLYCGDRPISDQPGAPTWQQVYDDRWRRLPAKFWKDAPQCDGLAVPGPASPPVAAPAPSPAAAGLAADAAAIAARIEADIAGTPDINPGQLARIPSEIELETETLRKMAMFARLLTDADPHITPKDLVSKSGMSRAWIMAMLPDLVTDEVVINSGKGQYRAVPGADVWAAIEAIRDRRARSLTGATA